MKICPSAKTVYIFLWWKLAVSSWVHEFLTGAIKRDFLCPIIQNLRSNALFIFMPIYVAIHHVLHTYITPWCSHLIPNSISIPLFVCCLQCSPNQLHLWTKIASLWSLLMKIIYLHYGKSFTFDPSSLTSPSYMYQKERMSFIWPYSAWP